ncbi:NADPH-dependent ferric siderophore reductase [Kineosphaera limosa]|uniref:Putative siderophore-interacting protein n=1 Tax=Kineosphaera limosa NBRC 100340 TaxID=1184609 RepID=K6W855_9MICO|nr:siderophore-interacting protein [Kineosphaera limosa]NYE00980.1 NADPH-dependent ferric siderophore reductase [Kineosphaera limosa]GAB95365.1 putative siderophore-interacting protein [Kineosphaera limosa NBRC 100340]
MAKTRRVPKSATVVRTEQVAPDYVRVILGGEDIAAMAPLEFTDHYVKLLFAPAGADYRWPFDPDAIQGTHPREAWPVTRTYTIRWLDREAGELALDFVVHGDSGLAAPWAATAQPGDTIGFFGPGGAWAPSPSADVHLFAGDESAAPAIAASLEAMPPGARAMVLVETADAAGHIPLPERAGIEVTWVHRDEEGLGYGHSLARVVRATPWPHGRVEAFVHGNADMIKDLRRYLFVERGLPRNQVSISGYWRTDHTEDRWQSSKGEFVAQMEAEEKALTRRRR